MLRTRDLVLFALVLIFLLVGIVSTTGSPREAVVSLYETVQFTTGEETVEVGVDTLFDRQANIADLRAKLADGAGVAAAGEPVFTSVDTPTSSEEQTVSVVSEERMVAACPVQVQYANFIGTWDVADIEERIGVRSYLSVTTEEVTVGSSTRSETSTRVRLQLPLAPQPVTDARCIDDEIIGVSLDGSLIRNTDVARFSAFTSGIQIGYARDGFPIFGGITDESELDACGGYDAGDGYAYYLRTDEPFVLACYRATPQPLRP